MRVTRIIGSSICGLMLGTTIYAQAPNQTPTQNSNATQNQRQSSQSDQANTMNNVIATCLALGNQEEVILGKLASEKSKNESVKEFANMMVEEHQATLKELERVAPGVVNQATIRLRDSGNSRSSSSNSTSSNSQPSNKTGQNTSSTNPSNPPSSSSLPQNSGLVSSTKMGSGSGQEINQLHRELAQQCLEDTKAKLSEEQGTKFDQCYVGTQLAKHFAMQSQLTVFQRHATGELKSLVSKGLETTKKHIKHAENLMEQLASSDQDASRKNSNR